MTFNWEIIIMFIGVMFAVYGSFIHYLNLPDGALGPRMKQISTIATSYALMLGVIYSIRMLAGAVFND